MNTLLCKSNKPDNKRKTKKKKKGKVTGLEQNGQIMRPERPKPRNSNGANSISSKPKLQNSSSTDGISSFDFGSDRDPFSNGGSLANRLGSDAT